jgi:hypothetical protein
VMEVEKAGKGRIHLRLPCAGGKEGAVTVPVWDASRAVEVKY